MCTFSFIKLGEDVMNEKKIVVPLPDFLSEQDQTTIVFYKNLLNFNLKSVS